RDRVARAISSTLPLCESAADAANNRLFSIEGTYHSHSAILVATDIWPTTAIPSIGPSMYVSQRTNTNPSPTEMSARKPRTAPSRQPSRREVQVTGVSSDRFHASTLLNKTLSAAAASQATVTVR